MPAQQWPHTFGRVPFFVDHPYFLSCLIPACYSVTIFVLALLTLKEVHEIRSNVEYVVSL